MTTGATVGLRAGGLFVVAWAYAVVRYVGFGDVPWSEVPLYVTNKAVSVTAAGLLALTLVAPRPPDPERQARRRATGLLGGGLALLHTVITLPLYSPRLLGRLYDGAGLNERGLWSTVLGALALAPCLAMLWLSRTRETGGAARGSLRWLGWLTVALTAAHCAAIGSARWLTPAEWPGALPPVTLLAVVGMAVVAAIAAARR